MKYIYNGVYLISMVAMIIRSYKAAVADNFKEEAYPTKEQITWKDTVLFAVFLFSFNRSENLYPIKWLTAPLLCALAAFYTWVAFRHYRIYKRLKPLLLITVFWVIVVVANVMTWNRLAG